MGGIRILNFGIDDPKSGLGITIIGFCHGDWDLVPNFRFCDSGSNSKHFRNKCWADFILKFKKTHCFQIVNLIESI